MPKNMDNGGVEWDNLLIELADQSDRFQCREGIVNNETRRGCYLQFQSGLVSKTYFYGMGREKGDTTWCPLIERTDVTPGEMAYFQF